MSAEIPMKIMFENIPRVHLYTVGYSKIGDSLGSLNMLRMRSGLHFFYIIYGYIFESNQVGKIF